jgi:hypothetical protein
LLAQGLYLQKIMKRATGFAASWGVAVPCSPVFSAQAVERSIRNEKSANANRL